MHNRTDGGGPIWDDRRHHGASAGRITTMWFTIAFLLAVSAALIIHKARVAARGSQANLGWMSAQWLAEHRSAHPS